MTLTKTFASEQQPTFSYRQKVFWATVMKRWTLVFVVVIP
jgi:hypothetical protein